MMFLVVVVVGVGVASVPVGSGRCFGWLGCWPGVVGRFGFTWRPYECGGGCGVLYSCLLLYVLCFIFNSITMYNDFISFGDPSALPRVCLCELRQTKCVGGGCGGNDGAYWAFVVLSLFIGLFYFLCFIFK